MNRILIHPDEPLENGIVELHEDRARHACSVLRAQPGQPLRIGLLNGPKGAGIVQEISNDCVVLKCEFEDELPFCPALDLLLAMPRPKVLKRLWAQLAALGVGRIFITNAQKVERCYFDTHILDPDFYTARLIEGLQQAGDTLLPDIQIVRHLKSFLEKEAFLGIGKKLIADPSADQSVFQCLEKPEGKVPDSGRIVLAIGPEGGWTPDELALFAEHGFELVGMGERILRTDTACIALISLISEIQRRTP